MADKIEHKTYGESEIEIPYGQYSLSEIENIITGVKAANTNKKVFILCRSGCVVVKEEDNNFKRHPKY